MMKQITIIIFILVFCIGILYLCTWHDYHAGITKVNYSIIYPDTTITKDSIFHFRYFKDKRIPYTDSHKGTNYIMIGWYEFEHTTCPIRINSYKIIE